MEAVGTVLVVVGMVVCVASIAAAQKLVVRSTALVVARAVVGSWDTPSIKTCVPDTCRT